MIFRQIKTFRLAKSLAGLTMGALMISPAAFAEDRTVELPQTAEAPVSVVQPTGFAGEPENLFQVFVGQVDTCCDGKTPMAGIYTHDSDVLSFIPAFGFSTDADYVVRIARPQGTEIIPFSLAPDVANVPAAVTAIYPSGDVLPENTLRFYIHLAPWRMLVWPD